MARLEQANEHLTRQAERVNEHLAELVIAIGELNQFKWKMAGALMFANVLGVSAVVKLLSH